MGNEGENTRLRVSPGLPDDIESAACAVAHGNVPAPATDRTLVAAFASPVANYLLHFAADTGFRAVLVEPDLAGPAPRGPRPTWSPASSGTSWTTARMWW